MKWKNLDKLSKKLDLDDATYIMGSIIERKGYEKVENGYSNEKTGVKMKFKVQIKKTKKGKKKNGK